MIMRTGLLIALALSASTCLAQSSGSSAPEPSSSSTTAPKERSQNGASYLCGGIGTEEAAYMKERAGKYGLMLTFATRDGAYLADVDVDIRDARGEPVLQANCDGPIMLVNLPADGTYRVRAETGGYVLNRTVHFRQQHAPGQVARAAILWPVAAGGRDDAAETATGGSGARPSGASESGRGHGPGRRGEDGSQ